MFKQFKNMKFKPLTTFYNWLFVLDETKASAVEEEPKASAVEEEPKPKHDSSPVKKEVRLKPKAKPVEPKRARTKTGRYKADDKSTPNINEAWVGGKKPTKKSKKG
jgi:hypothetical protein